ncbi:MAG: Gfo/Idh/MocA family oxidoreductase [Firmicutes bacterium]|nr:Gfo/Idh/MocA family oxidoreductase [Bacillota bacterium]
MAEEVRIGIIGTGGIAGSHVRYLKTIPGVRIVGGADIVPGKAEAFFKRWEIPEAKAFEDYRELLEEDIDAVCICTYNVAHYQPTMDSLAAGKHVLLEKPMSVTLEEGIDMVRAARKSGKILSIGFQSRWDPAIIKAREIVQSGQLGQVYYVETGGGRRRGIPGRTFVFKETAGGGAMLDIGCYSIDTAMYVLGHPKPLTVSAYLSNHFGTSPIYSKRASWGDVDPEKFDVDDFGAAMIRLEGGICFMLKMSWAMHMDSLGPMMWLGTDAGLKLDNGLKLYHDQAELEAQTELQLPKGQDRWSCKMGTFIEAVREGKPAPIPADEVLFSQAILDGIYRSAELGKEVEIQIPEDLQ